MKANDEMNRPSVERISTRKYPLARDVGVVREGITAQVDGSAAIIVDPIGRLHSAPLQNASHGWRHGIEHLQQNRIKDYTIFTNMEPWRTCPDGCM